MRIKPIHIRQADSFIELHHRHCGKRGNGKFAIACYADDLLVGVAIAGRPSSRHEDDGKTIEVYRVCTTGYRNATSFLYSRCKRIGQLMGYEKFMTYTLQEESGSSLRAIGAVIVSEVTHGKEKWNDSSGTKRNVTKVSSLPKYKWYF